MLYDSRTSKSPRRPTPLRFPLLSKHERARDPSLSFFVFASSPSHGLRNPNPRGGGKRKQERENSLARPLRRAMGRRKERRLAAKAAAGGRRVKLDLFLDPSPGESSYGLSKNLGGGGGRSRSLSDRSRRAFVISLSLA